MNRYQSEDSYHLDVTKLKRLSKKTFFSEDTILTEDFFELYNSTFNFFFFKCRKIFF